MEMMKSRIPQAAAVAAAVMLLAGCEPKPVPTPEPDRPQCYTAKKEAVGTLAGAQWAKGDSVRIVSTGLTFYVTEDCDGQAEALLKDPVLEDYDTPAIAVYPASFEVVMQDGAVSVPLPKEQYADDVRIPMLALSDKDGMMDFKTFCGVLEVNLEGCTDYSEIRLTSKGNETLWGNVLLSANDLQISGIEQINNECNTVVVRRSSPELTGNGTGTEWFSVNGGATVTNGLIDGTNADMSKVYFVLPAGTLKEGATLTVIDSHQGFLQTDLEPNEVMPGQILSSAVIEYADQSEVNIRTDVLNKAFYKDIFMDSGISLTQNPSMPIVEFLGLELEHMLAKSDDAGKARQQRLLCGDADDLNGVLLYPDGAPRFRMIYVSGGGSNNHGLSIGATGRQAIRDFNFAGGSYIGSCAGAYVSSKGVFNYSVGYSDGFIGIYPGVLYRSSTENIYTTHTIPTDSPILKYYDFGGDYRIDSVRHHNGPYFQEYYLVPGAEVLTRFDYPAYRFHTHPAIVAYKENAFKGRVIPCGSHPEQVDHGENLLLMAALAQYAFDGVGCARVKAVLRNGATRVMDKSTDEKDPAHTMIGDLQCHHFAFALPAGARDIKVRMTTPSSHRLSLRLAQDTFAFKEDAQYALEDGTGVKELKFDSLPAGTWYIGVQCEDTVTATKDTNEYIYTNKDVLNGVPYTISVTWR